ELYERFAQSRVLLVWTRSRQDDENPQNTKGNRRIDEYSCGYLLHAYYYTKTNERNLLGIRLRRIIARITLIDYGVRESLAINITTERNSARRLAYKLPS